MLHPEPTGLLIGAGECQRIALGMREEGGVKIRAETVLFAELHPRGEVPRLQFVPAYPFTGGKNGVACVEVQLFCAGALQHLFDVRHQLPECPCPAGIAAGGLDAAGEGLGGVGVEATHIIALPAVQRDRGGFQLRNRRLSVYADSCVFFFCFRIAHRSASICILRLPSAVASMDRAMTCLPVALAVRWLRNSFFAPPPTM